MKLADFLATLSRLVGGAPGLRGAPPRRPGQHTRSGVGQSTRYAKDGLAGLRRRPRWGRKLNGLV